MRPAAGKIAGTASKGLGFGNSETSSETYLARKTSDQFEVLLRQKSVCPSG